MLLLQVHHALHQEFCNIAVSMCYLRYNCEFSASKAVLTYLRRYYEAEDPHTLSVARLKTTGLIKSAGPKTLNLKTLVAKQDAAAQRAANAAKLRIFNALGQPPHCFHLGAVVHDTLHIVSPPT